MKLTDIRDTIHMYLSDNFNISIYDGKQEQGFDRPSFFIQILSVNTEKVNKSYNFKTVLASIEYFSHSNSMNECLEIEEKLEDIFINVLDFKGQNINIEKSQSKITSDSLGNILNYQITVEYYKKTKHEEHDIIQNVNTNF